jgi:MFS family permease
MPFAVPWNRLPAALAPLAVTDFRNLWVVWLAANTCMWMNDVAAAWLMTSLTASPAWVALVQTASTLPVFLLGLPSGALADIIDRRRWFAFTQLWVAATGALLAFLALGGLLNAPLLLLLTFLNGIGLALRWPVFSAIVPNLVSREQMPAALGLNGMSMNLSRIVGPIAAGALLAGAGSAWVFALNAIISVLSFFQVLRWRSAPRASTLPGERFVGAMRVGLQHVRQSPPMKAVLLRVFLLFLHSTALTALLPLVAQGAGGGAGTFTLMLATTGVGAVIAIMLLPRLRQRFGTDHFVRGGTLTHAAMTAIVAYSPTLWLTMPALLVSGAAWIVTANSLAVSAQMVLPDWVRARGMSLYQMALMGGAASGAALWGQVATHTSVPQAMAVAAVSAVLALMLTRRVQVGAADPALLEPARPNSQPRPAVVVQPDEGPVMVTIEYLIDPDRAEAFAAVMRETRAARMRQGALSWGLFRDTEVPGRYIEYFVDETWVEHLRRQERFTAADIGLRGQRLAFHRGAEPPAVRRYVSHDVLV